MSLLGFLKSFNPPQLDVEKRVVAFRAATAGPMDSNGLQQVQHALVYPIVLDILKNVSVSKSERTELEGMLKGKWSDLYNTTSDKYASHFNAKIYAASSLFSSLMSRYVPESSGSVKGTRQTEGFTIHDTLGTEKFSEALPAIQEASALLRAAGYGKLLYGDMYIVGSIRDHSTKAFYRFEYDDVFIRADGKREETFVRTICHELGHRLWHKFKGVDQAYYASLYKSLKRPLKEGDIIHDRTGGTIEVLRTGPKGSLNVRDIDGNGVEIRTRKTDMKSFSMFGDPRFVTAYAAVSTEELFAELFAATVTRTAKPHFAKQFADGIR